MPPNRRTQHRPKRETQEIRASEYSEMRSENQRLRREVAKLKREITKRDAMLTSISGGFFEQVPEAPKSELPPESTEAKIGCLACGSAVMRQVKLGPKTLTVCAGCNFRVVA